MPLIFAAVAFLTLFVVLHDARKKYDRESADLAKRTRKTNAYLERKLLDGFMKQGMTFGEAYAAAAEETVRLGYEPCIPKEAYGKAAGADPAPEETSWAEDPGAYDSRTVRKRRELLYGGERKPWNDGRIYEDFPADRYECRKESERRILKHKTIPAGRFIIYPGYGTCEILGHLYDASGTKGFYKVRVVGTGRIWTGIPIGDVRIRKTDDRID